MLSNIQLNCNLVQSEMDKYILKIEKLFKKIKTGDFNKTLFNIYLYELNLNINKLNDLLFLNDRGFGQLSDFDYMTLFGFIFYFNEISNKIEEINNLESMDYNSKVEMVKKIIGGE